MPLEPREQQTIYESLRDRLEGKIPGLSNFTDTSFNWVWTQGFSSEFREQELEKTAAYLSGLIDYAGGPITDEDLQELGFDDVVTADELNPLLDDQDLDELVKIVGITRDGGAKATGSVTFTTQTQPTTIPAGTSVGLQPDEDGSFLEFVTDTTVDTSSGVTSVTTTVTAAEVGAEYNVGSGTITYLPNPPSGVQSVTNANSTEGGVDGESNDDLRARAKRAIFESSGGGTVAGIIGFIESNVDDVSEVEIVEFFNGDTFHGNFSHAHVIVSGGDEQEILDAIESSRPVAVAHFLIRPDSFPVRVDASLEGEDIDTVRVKEQIRDYIDGLGLNDEVVDAKIIQRIMNADSDIEDIPVLEFYMEDEEVFYDPESDIYTLEQGGIMADDGIVNVEGDVDGNIYTFTEDAEYVEWNTTAGDETAPQDSINIDKPDTLAVADDGGAQTTETTAANEDTADDMTLLPASPAVGDAYYFGNTDAEFTNLFVNVSTAGAGTWDIVWEYWDGSAWSALSNVSDGTSDFQTAGDNPVSWSSPTDWDTTSVNSVGPAYWVRARLDSFSSLSTQPLGQDADLGEVPDVTSGVTETLTFSNDTDRYLVSESLITDGVTNIDGELNGSAHTFTEGTDYEEVDVRGDGEVNGIDWSIGGDSPDDETDFTVTYDSGAAFRVTYRIEDGTDIKFDKQTQPVSGTVNITLV